MLDIANKAGCIFGLPDSGKSTLANYILKQYGTSAFVYDTLREYPAEPFDSYAPQDQYSVEEFEGIIRAAFTCGRYRLILIDECNRFCPSKPVPLPPAVADLNDWRAHYSIAAVYIARRPVQLNQDLTELSQYVILFKLDGKNDVQYLNDLYIGLGEAVFQLPKYGFILYNKGEGFQQFSPIPKDFITDKKIRA